MGWTRASSLERALACPSSTVFPTVERKSDRVQDAADWGSLAHAWKSTGVIQDHRFARLLERHIEECGVDRLALWPAGGRHDVAIAVNCQVDAFAEAELETQAERDAWKASWGDGWVTGEWDYCGDILGEPWVDDLKTGWAPEPDAPQPMFYGLGAWYSTRRTAAQVCLTITRWPRPNLYARNPRAFHPPTRTPDLWVPSSRLAEFRQQLIMGHDNHTEAAIDPDRWAVPGEHCRFCPAHTCPHHEEQR